MTYKPQRFASVLRYLVEKHGSYVHPSRTGYTSGQEAWADPSLQFSCYADAKTFARRIDGEVIKLRVSAKLERVKRGAGQPETASAA